MSTIGQIAIDQHGNERVLVHYVYLTGLFVLRRGQKAPKMAIACNPGVDKVPGWQITNEARAVSCPACMKTEKYLMVARDMLAMENRNK